MKYQNKADDPQLLGIVETQQDIINISKLVEGLNKDLVDSGFTQYQYQTVRRGNKVYIELM